MPFQTSVSSPPYPAHLQLKTRAPNSLISEVMLRQRLSRWCSEALSETSTHAQEKTEALGVPLQAVGTCKCIAVPGHSQIPVSGMCSQRANLSND